MHALEQMLKSKFLTTILMIFFMSQVFGQTYETRKITAKADSILKGTVGDYLYPYFKYDNDTYYEYATKRNKKKWENLTKKSKTKGAFKNTFIRFNFHHPDYPWIHNFGGMHLDSLLNLSKPFDVKFIPDFLRERKESNYISKQQAVEISRKSLLKVGIKEIEARLIYDLFKIEGYSWLILNYFEQNKAELVIIEPITGKVLEHYSTHIGLLHGDKK